jgi:hypothetical protein
VVHFVNDIGWLLRCALAWYFVWPKREHTSRRKYCSHAALLATATQSLRFYREYFKPTMKSRLEKNAGGSWFLSGYEFFINIDTSPKQVW